MSRILLIDGHDQHRELVARELGARGHDVVVATTPLEAVARIPADLPDVVLMASKVVGLDPYATARRLKADPATARVLLVAMTSVLQTERLRATECGFDAAFSRPIDFGVLQSRLDAMLLHRPEVAAPANLRIATPRQVAITGMRPSFGGVASPLTPPVTPAPASSNGAHLLVVDDDENNRDLLSRRLLSRGYRVTTCSSGGEALARIEKECFDIVLLDWMMPGVSGLAVLQQIRQTRNPGDLPVIMVTAKTQPEDIAQALEAGASDYVTKPIELPVVLARIGTQLALKKATASLRATEARFRLLAERSPDLIARQAADGTWLYLSEACRTLLGYHPKALVGTSSYDLVHPDDYGNLGMRLAVEDGMPDHFSVTCRLRKGDNTWDWFETTYAVLKDDAGAVIEVQAACRNVAEHVLERHAGLETVLQHLARTSDQRAQLPGGRAARVSHAAQLLYRRAGGGPARGELLRRASLLHDLGLVTVSTDILRRAGPLDLDEHELVRSHAEAGFRLLTGSGDELLDLAASVARTHHEHWDGSGYPRGLAGRAIPLEGRIVAIADAFDALTSDRPWRASLSTDDALTEMERGRGIQFDPELLDHLRGGIKEIIALRQSYPDG